MNMVSHCEPYLCKAAEVEQTADELHHGPIGQACAARMLVTRDRLTLADLCQIAGPHARMW